MMLMKRRPIITICLSLVLLFGLFPIQANVYADQQDNTGMTRDNIDINANFALSYKYEKKLNLEGMDNRDKIPDVAFDYFVEQVPNKEFNKAGIHKEYKNSQNKRVIKIFPGLPIKNNKYKLSSVRFSQDDLWDGKDEFGNDAKFNDLSKMIDSYDSSASILDFMIVNCWGEMRSSDHIQTAVVRKSTPFEMYSYERYSDRWGTGMSPWRCFHEGTDGSYEDGCQSLLEYDASDFSYVDTFALRANPALTYFVYGVHEPTISYLTHATKDNNGKYTSVSKALFKNDEIEKFLNNYDRFSDTNYYSSDDFDNIDENGINVIRYYIKEKSYSDSFEADKKPLILDIYHSQQENVKDGNVFLLGTNSTATNYSYRIFNSPEEADNYYKNNFTNNFYDDQPVAYSYATPSASFESKFNGKQLPQTKNIRVSALWCGNGDYTRGPIKANLLKDGKLYKSVELDEKNEWRWKFTDLPLYNENGTIVKYTLEEENVKDGKLKVSGNEFNVTINGDDEYGFIIINKFIPKDKDEVEDENKCDKQDQDAGETNDDIINIPVEVKGMDNFPNISSIDVSLYMDGKLTESLISITKDNGWKGRFDNLPKIDIDNNDAPLKYTVGVSNAKGEFVNLNGIKASIAISGTMENGYTINLKKITSSSEGNSSSSEDVNKSKNGTVNNKSNGNSHKSANSLLDNSNKKLKGSGRNGKDSSGTQFQRPPKPKLKNSSDFTNNSNNHTSPGTGDIKLEHIFIVLLLLIIVTLVGIIRYKGAKHGK